MKKFFLFFFLFCFVGVLFIAYQPTQVQAQTKGIVADNPDDQIDTWSENEIAKVSRGSVNVRPGLGKGAVVEYFGDAHQKSLLNQAKEAGFTTIEAQGLIDVALIEKRTLKGKGPEALANFYAKLDKKRAERGTSLDSTKAEILAEVDRRIAKAKADGLTEGLQAMETLRAEMVAMIDKAKKEGLAEGISYVNRVATEKTTEFNEALKPINDPTTGLAATYQLAKDATDRMNAMDAAWGQVVKETNAAIAENRAAINKVDRKARLVDAKVNYLGGRVKVNKDKTTKSNAIVFPDSVDGKKIDIGENIFPEEKPKDSSPSGTDVKSNCK